MVRTRNISELVSRAQKGDRESLGALSAYVRRRMFVYLYRVTLDYHLTEDLVQETLLYMIESLPRLKTASNSSLWAWIYRSAWGIFHHYLRPQGHQRIIQNTVVDHEALLKLTADVKENALEHAERAELCEAICKSLGTMRARQRSVLVLRCFELFSYAEIAAVMGCSEIRARVLFFNAKHALKRRLHNRGFGREYFLTGLSLFGFITAAHTKTASAAVTVTSSMVKTPTIAAVIGVITAELGLVKTAVVTIAIVAGTICVCSLYAGIPTESTINVEVAGIGNTDLLSNIAAVEFALPDPCDVDPNEPKCIIPPEADDRPQPPMPPDANQPTVQVDQLSDPNDINTRQRDQQIE